MAKKAKAEELAGLALFGGKSPEEIRELLKVPADFRVEGFLGVPIEKIPYKYLRVFLDGAVYEARVIRRKFDDAARLGDEMGINPPAEESPKD